MPPRLDPRLYVIRLAWLGRRTAQRGAYALCACPRSIAARACLSGNGRGGSSRWARPALGRHHA